MYQQYWDRLKFKIKIETYWNVNCSADDKNSCGRKIKIETYWNVNKTNG